MAGDRANRVMLSALAGTANGLPAATAGQGRPGASSGGRANTLQAGGQDRIHSGPETTGYDVING